MNRAARLSDKAGSGQVWVTASAWDGPGGSGDVASAFGLMGTSLGAFQLKGVVEAVEVVQVQMT